MGGWCHLWVVSTGWRVFKSNVSNGLFEKRKVSHLDGVSSGDGVRSVEDDVSGVSGKLVSGACWAR